MSRSLVRCHEWVALAHGDPAEVERLLDSVGSVGKKRSLLWGEVERWDVERVDLPPEGCLHDGLWLIRTLPAWAASGLGISMAEPSVARVGFTPPSWSPGLQREGWRCGSPLAG